jgi:predicted Rdx family selenoprotein
LAASLKARFGEDVEIAPGSTGQFDVIANGKLIFSKAEVHRFPVDDEVEGRFATLKEGRELPPLETSAPSGGFVARILDRLRN